MQISKERYEELMSAEACNAEEQEATDRAIRRASKLREALEDVVKVANGQAIVSDPPRRGLGIGEYAMTNSYPMNFASQCGHVVPPTDEQVREAEVASLNQRITFLECRLASVTTAAQFSLRHLS